MRILYSSSIRNYKIPSRKAMPYDIYSWFLCRIKTRMCSFVPINPLFVNLPSVCYIGLFANTGFIANRPATN